MSAAGLKVNCRSIDGSEVSEVDLDPEIFGMVPNVALMHQVVTAQAAGARAGTQSTRTRAEVRGGGAKPLRQKGTGRARQGSTRAPQWAGGGVALGPKPRSYKQRTPRKMLRAALRSALSDRALGQRVCVVDAWTFPAPRTKDAVAALDALGVHGRLLVVIDATDEVAARSFANLRYVKVVSPAQLSTYDVLRSDWVIFTSSTLPTALLNEESGADVTQAEEPDPQAGNADASKETTRARDEENRS
ncbi:MAG: 50S ribosomal protein L4 [Acidimicrobiales bacterium]